MINPTPGTRTLTVGDVGVPIREDDVRRLYDLKMVYDCGDGHDLHIDPDHDWSLEGIEALALAVHYGTRRQSRVAG